MSRRKLTSLLGTAIALVTFLQAFAVSTSGFSDSRHQTFELRLATDVLVSDSKTKHGFSFTWRIYDRQGRLVGELSSGDDTMFRNALNTVLKTPEPLGTDSTLSWELGRLEESDGRPLKKLREADFTIVRYWAESCASCQASDKAATRVMQSVLESYKNKTVNILHVDVDIPKRVKEVEKKP